jgi:predicted AAA+ superfamily ATPase
MTDYMREEIMEEGLVRNVPAFSRFVDVLGFCSGELVSYANIARESGVDAKTVREYFRILEDTHLGSLVEPYTGARKRSIVARTPRFYLFDVGVAGYLTRRVVKQTRGPEFGRALEHLVFMELTAYRAYSEKSFDINYWRTTTGLEVDFVLANGEVAIEVKGKRLLTNKDTRGLRTFIGETPNPCTGIVVSGEPAPRKVGEIAILPWAVFLERLWNGEVI